MITSLDELDRILQIVFHGHRPPKPLHLVGPVIRVRNGSLTIAEAARLAGTTQQRVRRLAVSDDALVDLLGEDPQVAPTTQQRVRDSLGQLLIGNIAERVFEEFYRVNVGTAELELRDDRSTRGDTDYLVFNGSGRQVFRINIKFHGSLFRRAKELVGLDPEDCFALATYKIHSALQKQEAEHLPYIFVIVGVPGLTGSVVGAAVPSDLVDLCALVRDAKALTGVRSVEDQIVDRLAQEPETFDLDEALREFRSRIERADWYVLSARRAFQLLGEKLFERAYALRV